MPSTFSPSLKIELIASGEASGTWGVRTNNNLGDLIEQAIAYTTSVNVTSGDVTLTSLNGVVDQARSAVIEVTGTPGDIKVVTIPNVQKTYTVRNRTGQIAQVKTSTGTAFNCPPLSDSYLVCDGANGVVGRSITDGANAITSLATPFTSPAFIGVPTAPTATLGSNTTQIATTAFVNAEIASDTANLAPLNSPALTGIPTAPIAAVGTNTTQLATTAFVNAEIANDAPTKTGDGASGTWGISVTGNAATATNATNATNVTGTVASGVTGTTQTFGTNNTSIATTAFVQGALQAVYPVGSVYINASDITSPATLLGFGTWLAIGAGRVLVGQDISDTLFDVMGETGGSKDAIVVTHSHTGSGTTASTSISHTHGFSGSGSTGGAGAHSHSGTSVDVWFSRMQAYNTGVFDVYIPEHGQSAVLRTGGGDGGFTGMTATNTATTRALSINGVGDHVHSVSVSGTTGATDPSHTHGFSFTTASAGASGTNANVQPYLVVKMWQRTA